MEKIGKINENKGKHLREIIGGSPTLVGRKATVEIVRDGENQWEVAERRVEWR